AMARSVEEARRLEGPFKGLEDFIARIDTRQVNQRALESLIKAGAFDSTAGGAQGRAALLEALPGVLATGSRLHDEHAGGQASLFDLGPRLEATPHPVTAWSDGQRLAHEKEVL